MEPVIFFSSAPVLEELCAITVCVKKSSLLVTSQPHVLKCRELIFSESAIIASPSYDIDGCFNIIMQISFCKTGRLQARLQKQGLEFSKPFRVHPTMYQSCLRYTVTARLAPSWNKAGEWHIQGRDFVTHHGYANAVKINLCVNKDEIFASLSGTMVRCSPLQVEDLNLSRQEMLNILKSTQEDGRQVELQDSWCHVLPSMKKGRILSVSLLMPNESPFSGYSELKRHWKNTYGYRLPETDEDILYCQVSFLPSGGGKHFTYPDVCLRHKPAQCMSRVDCKPILSSFLQDVHARVGHVCGQPLRFTPKMHFPSMSLHDANEEVPHASLSNKRSNKSTNSKLPLRSSQNVMHMKQRSSSQDLPSLRSKFVDQLDISSNTFMSRDKDKTAQENVDINSHINHESNNQCEIRSSDNSNNVMKYSSEVKSAERIMSEPNVNKSCFKDNDKAMKLVSNLHADNSTFPTHPTVKGTDFKGAAVKENELGSRFTQTNQTSRDISLSSQSSKLIPTFKPQKKIASDINIENNKGSKNTAIQKFTPVFKSKMPLSSSSSAIKTHSKTQANTSNANIIPSSQPNTMETPLFPVFRPKSKPVYISNHKPPKNSVQPSSSHQLKKTPTFSNSSSSLSAQAITKPSTPGSKALPQFSSREFKLSTASPSSQFKGKSSLLPSLAAASSSPYPLSSPGLGYGSKDTPGGKRKIGVAAMDHPGTPTTTAKKPRSKPQVQNLDVDGLARANQLNKANTATLMTWLKERGIACRAKDKKTDLVEKVQSHLGLNLSASEP